MKLLLIILFTSTTSMADFSSGMLMGMAMSGGGDTTNISVDGKYDPFFIEVCEFESCRSNRRLIAANYISSIKELKVRTSGFFDNELTWKIMSKVRTLNNGLYYHPLPPKELMEGLVERSEKLCQLPQ